MYRASPDQEPFRRRTSAAAWALAGALLLNLPNFIYPYFEDTALFAVIGKWMHQGLLPYRDLVEQKPPGIFWVAFATNALFGASSIGSRIAELVAILAMAIGCGRVVRTVHPAAEPWAILMTGAFCSGAFWRLPERGQVEIFEAAAMAWAVALLAEALRGRGNRPYFLSGVALSIAASFKPQAAVLVIPAVVAIAIGAPPRESLRYSLRRTTVLGAGVAAGAAPFFAWLLGTRSLTAFIEVARAVPKSYLSLAPQPTLETALARLKPYAMPSGTALLVLLFAGAGLIFAARSTGSNRERAARTILLGGWLAAAFIQFYTGRYLFNYHKLILIPAVVAPTAIGSWISLQALAALVLKHAPRASRLSAAGTSCALFIVLATTPKLAFEAVSFAQWILSEDRREAWCRFGIQPPYYDYCQQSEVAARVRSATSESGRIQVITLGAVVYLESERLPATRFPISSIALDSRYLGHEEMSREFIAGISRPATEYVVVRSGDYFPWFDVPPGYVYVDREPRLAQALSSQYVPDGEIVRGYFGFHRGTERNAP